jgi:hypothetical protein
MGETEARRGLSGEDNPLTNITKRIGTDNEMRYGSGTDISRRVEKHWETVSDGHSIGKQA